MSDTAMIFLLFIIVLVATFAVAHLGYYQGKRAASSISPLDLIEIMPLPYVAFQPGSRKEDKIAFLESCLAAMKNKRSAEVTRLEDGRLRPSSLKEDEESRAAFYDQSLKSGLVPPESHSTSSRNSRGPQ
jgi:hypothetical protein